jgi:hypothetical protein
MIPELKQKSVVVGIAMSTGYTIVWAATAVVLCIWSLATPNIGGWGGIVSILLLVALIAWRNSGGSGRPNPTATGKRENTIEGAFTGAVQRGIQTATETVAGAAKAAIGATDTPVAPAAAASKGAAAAPAAAAPKGAAEAAPKGAATVTPVAPAAPAAPAAAAAATVTPVAAAPGAAPGAAKGVVTPAAGAATVTPAVS